MQKEPTGYIRISGMGSQTGRTDGLSVAFHPIPVLPEAS